MHRQLQKTNDFFIKNIIMKHVTIKDIARSLCISVSTVSRALTDDKNIRKETREMVIEEAKRLGYKRNPVANRNVFVWLHKLVRS